MEFWVTICQGKKGNCLLKFGWAEARKHSSVEEAIKYELSQIRKALGKAHINDAGELVEKVEKET